MQLHQILRHVQTGVPIVLFNLKGISICEVRTKENIDIDLYEYDILEINIGRCNIKGCNYAIYITLIK